MKDRTSQKELPTRIAVVASAGGSEHAVSLRSAENVASALRENFETVEIFPYDADLERSLVRWKPDVVFPVAHGVGGESGELQTDLDSMALPYVGSGAKSSAMCWNKCIANQSILDWLDSAPDLPAEFRRFGVPKFAVLKRGDDISKIVLEFCYLWRETVHVLVIKPACEGSSVGISFRTSPFFREATKEEVFASIAEPISKMRLRHIVDVVEEAFAFSDAVLLQEAISGTEITVGVLEEEDSALALPVVEIVTPRGEWFDYEHKYSAVRGSKHIIPARLPDTVVDLAQEMAVSLHKHFDCMDLSRIDLLVSHPENSLQKHRLWFLESNTSPGLTELSLFPHSAEAAGIGMADLTRKLVLRAWRRGNFDAIDRHE